MNALKVAILIDGGFFIKRYYKLYSNAEKHTPQEVAKNLYTMAHRHVGEGNYLYRIFYYDCTPLSKRVHNPINEKVLNFSTTEQSKFRMAFFEELKKKRKVALRLGYLKDSGKWIIKPKYTRDLIKGKIKLEDLKEGGITYEMKQKGIDIKIGVDISTLALKQFVDKIILVSGDSDFVPAAKLARREGIDFVLDPMWNPIDASLFEHIDGLHSTCPRPKQNTSN
jgi:uncharacterized LabA/DUF88 family protein